MNKAKTKNNRLKIVVISLLILIAICVSIFTKLDLIHCLIPYKKESYNPLDLANSVIDMDQSVYKQFRESEEYNNVRNLYDKTPIFKNSYEIIIEGLQGGNVWMYSYIYINGNQHSCYLSSSLYGKGNSKVNLKADVCHDIYKIVKKGVDNKQNVIKPDSEDDSCCECGMIFIDIIFEGKRYNTIATHYRNINRLQSLCADADICEKAEYCSFEQQKTGINEFFRLRDRCDLDDACIHSYCLKKQNGRISKNEISRCRVARILNNEVMDEAMRRHECENIRKITKIYNLLPKPKLNLLWDSTI